MKKINLGKNLIPSDDEVSKISANLFSLDVRYPLALKVNIFDLIIVPRIGVFKKFNSGSPLNTYHVFNKDDTEKLDALLTSIGSNLKFKYQERVKQDINNFVGRNYNGSELLIVLISNHEGKLDVSSSWKFMLTKVGSDVTTLYLFGQTKLFPSLFTDVCESLMELITYYDDNK